MTHSAPDPRSAADDLDFALYRLLLELRFAAHLATLGDTQPLNLPSEYLAIALNGYAERLEAAMRTIPDIVQAPSIS